MTFDSAAATTTDLSFTIDGYLSLDGQNFYEDDFGLSLNGSPLFAGTFNLGGGSNTTQAVVYLKSFWRYPFQPDEQRHGHRLCRWKGNRHFRRCSSGRLRDQHADIQLHELAAPR